MNQNSCEVKKTKNSQVMFDEHLNTFMDLYYNMSHCLFYYSLYRKDPHAGMKLDRCRYYIIHPVSENILGKANLKTACHAIYAARPRKEKFHKMMVIL